MTIDRLGPVDPLSNYKKVHKSSRTDTVSKGDSIQVSAEAQKSAEMLKAAETVRSAPDVRMDRIAEVKAKMENPDYINDKGLNSVADSIMDSFGL